jgi:hypothetical protein
MRMSKVTFNKATSMYVGNGLEFDTKQEALYFGVLGLCGCGNPDQVHELLIECLETFEPYEYGLQKLVAVVKEKPEIVAEFIAHFLDKFYLIEHGSNVYGSWLTEEGRDFIEAGPVDFC